jgi:His-Xaa-Ser system radical SAM maturase HxsC
MLTLSGRVVKTTSEADQHSRQLYSLSTKQNLPDVLKKGKAFLAKSNSPIPSGFAHYFVFNDSPSFEHLEQITLLGDEFKYLDEEDVVSLSSDGRLRSIYRANSNHNSILLTERCNNFCVMCSQPPKRTDDSWLLEEAFEAIRLIPRNAQVLGFTGGEPTLYGDEFIRLLHHTKNWLPNTSIHLLSNGRSFSDITYAKKYAEVDHPDLMIGIPVYSSNPATHDYVVQAHNAFDETIRGILNLKRLRQKVEIRVVLHKQTYKGLVELANFIARNLLFVDQVALMGLEHIGFARANIESLWIDPVDYKDELSEATQILNSYGIKTLIYNHPLCLVNEDVYSNYVKSISDWKNEFATECEPCTKRSECGGFFSSGIKHGYSTSLKPFTKT